MIRTPENDTPQLHAGRAALRVAALLAASLLLACESTPEVVPVDDPERAWAEHQARLAAIDRWSAVGKLGVQSAEDSWSAGIQWRQDQDSYNIRLRGPLGQGLMELRGEPGSVEMQTADDVYRARTAEELMQTHAGWRVPLNGLRYWILGRPDPNAVVDAYSLDAAGRLAELHQLGWVIHIERYATFDGTDLPTRMTLENPRVRAKLILRTWQTGADAT
ncbi:MAG: lipoprotein insertase outer membrane protein LolB [Gammaproteobacteria bacterium]|nr:lipoprotein insertase outer membrane protein LolB [Gammaproteobacteria bacterium]